MSKSFNISVEGLAGLQTSLKNYSRAVQQQVEFEIQESANNIVNRAVADAPVDQGLLKNQITSFQSGALTFDVVSPTDYAPYIEFGTRKRVQVPAELQSVAAQFKGSRSSAVTARKAIFEWCRRKGIDEKLWFPIYRSIMTNGIRPQPYFFKQLAIERAELIKNIKAAISR